MAQNVSQNAAAQSSRTHRQHSARNEVSDRKNKVGRRGEATVHRDPFERVDILVWNFDLHALDQGSPGSGALIGAANLKVFACSIVMSS